MKKPILGMAITAGIVAAGAICLMNKRRPAELQPVTSAEALLTPQLQALLAERVREMTPDNGFAMILSDDRGDLSREMAGRCRMLFSADGSGAAAVQRPYWPENIIRAACDPRQLWLAENSLDLAVMVNVLQRYEDPAAVLAELRRVLRADGRLLLPMTVRTEAFSESAWLSTMALLGIPAKHAWTQAALYELLTAEKWEILSQETLDGSFPMVVYQCRCDDSSSSAET